MTRHCFSPVFLLFLLFFVACGEKEAVNQTAERPTEQPATTRENSATEQPQSEKSNRPQQDQGRTGGNSRHPAAPSGREWKDEKGEILAVGEFVSLMDGMVGIMSSNGAIQIPLDKLSAPDREFLASKATLDLAQIEGERDDPGQFGGEILKTAENPDLKADSDVTIDADDPRDESGLYAGQKVFVPFDLESKFDNGRYGELISNNLYQKIGRARGFILPESIQDVRSLSEMVSFHPNPDTPLNDVAKTLKNSFNAQVAAWGKIERVELEVYDFTLICVDFSQNPPKIIHGLRPLSEKDEIPHEFKIEGIPEPVPVTVIATKQVPGSDYVYDIYRTNAIGEVAGIHLENMLAALYERKPGEKIIDPVCEENWAKNPNLVVNGDFEKAVNGIPVGWETHCAQHREPIGRLVRWTTDSSDPNNHVINFTFGADIGDGFGLMYYSKPFPVEEGALYRFQARFKTTGPKPIIFIKCSDVIDSRFNPMADGHKEGFDDTYGKQTREVYRSQQNLSGQPNTWNIKTEDFTPRHTKYSPKFGRVMLYGYLGAGTIEFDDIVIKQIRPASPGDKKELRHSLDTNVSLEEMRENERRDQESRKK